MAWIGRLPCSCRGKRSRDGEQVGRGVGGGGSPMNYLRAGQGGDKSVPFPTYRAMCLVNGINMGTHSAGGRGRAQGKALLLACLLSSLPATTLLRFALGREGGRVGIVRKT